MDISVKRFKHGDKEIWDRFVLKSNNGTIFHKQKFLAYHPIRRFRNHHLFFLGQGKIMAVFPAVVRNDNDVRVLSSHSGASLGGIVFPVNTGINEVHTIVGRLCEYSRAKGFQRIEMTLPPIIYLQQPNQYLDFCLLRHGFQYRKREISSLITLNIPPERILSTFKNEARTAVRKALKLNVRVRSSQDYDTFYSILKTNLKLRHNVTPTHTLNELIKVKSLLPSDVKLFGAYIQDRMVAGMTLFRCNPRVTLAFYISHLEVYQKYRPVNLLMYEVIKWALLHNYHYLDLGIFTVNMDPNWGLGRFKESFGAHGIFRDTLYLDL